MGNAEVNTKSDTVSLDKTVDSSTDSDGETTADYGVGDNVPFTLTATLPSNYADYDPFKLTFGDTLSSGLSFNNDVVVTVYTVYAETTWGTGTYYTYASGTFTEVDTTTVTAPDPSTTYYTATVVQSGYTLDTSSQDYTFEVQIADTNSLYSDANSTDKISVSGTSIITVTYTAELTADATTTETNQATLEYSNDPNSEDTGKTTTDITTVFTIQLDLDKVDENGNPLEGAGFTLYKEATGITAFESGTTYYTVENGTMTEATGSFDDTKIYYVKVGTAEAGYQVAAISSFAEGVTYYTTSDGGVTYSTVDTTVTTAPVSGTTYYVKNQFAFEGLGVGKYVLVESTTPSGYNTMEDLSFTIAAVTQEDANGNASVTELTISGMSGSTDTSTQTISANIENAKGSNLPSTGGIGTTIFYIVGGVLVVGAAVLLITRKRMKNCAE